MADRFGTAIYTYCRKGQGLDGIAGMQFQARSPDVDRDALKVVRQQLLYEPPAPLLREQRPVGEYPVSFSHTADGVFATASGVYLGQESGGTREGNHLTHAIITRDPGGYGAVRPAQLFRAPFWTTRPAPTTSSPPVDSVVPGLLGVAGVRRFVHEQPDGSALLTALVTAVTHPEVTGRRRVLMVSDDAALVMSWLIAATLLMPQRQAVRIGFKVFTNDPARAHQTVVAVHPEWSRTTATVERDLGFAVFDLVRHQRTSVPAVPGVRDWVNLFVTEDPAVISDAVDLADASGLDMATSRELALAAILHRTPSVGRAHRLIEWLGSGSPALRQAYGGSLVAALSNTDDLQVLRKLDAAVSTDLPWPRRREVRLRLLRAELRHALTGPVDRSALATLRPPAPLPDATAGEVTDLVIAALRQARDDRFDAVLRIAARFDAAVSLDAVADAAAAFFAHWADRPDAPYRPADWPSTLRWHLPLRNELALRVNRASDVATVDTVADTWWERLNPEPFPARRESPLDCALLSAAMLRTDERRRLSWVDRVIGRLDSDLPGAFTQMTAVLWRRCEPTVEELRLVARSDGGHLPPRVLRGLLHRIGGPTPLNLDDLALYELLRRRGKVGAVGPDLSDVDTAAQTLLAEHRWLCDPDGSEGTKRIDTVSTRILTAHLLQGLAPDRSISLSVLSALVGREPESTVTLVLPVLERSGWPPHRAAVVFFLLRTQRPKHPVPKSHRAGLERALIGWFQAADNQHLDAMAHALRVLGPAWIAKLRTEVEDARRRLPRKNPEHRDG
jgi:hypothetical protein